MRHQQAGYDDTDFRSVVGNYSDREAGCTLCELGAELNDKLVELISSKEKLLAKRQTKTTGLNFCSMP